MFPEPGREKRGRGWKNALPRANLLQFLSTAGGGFGAAGPNRMQRQNHEQEQSPFF